MVRRIQGIALAALFCFLSVFAGAQTKPSTPKPGSAERKAIMDALRVPVEKELKKKVVFKVDHLKVLNDWAFMRGVPQQPNGKPIDYRGTVHQEAIDAGAFDGGMAALLHKKNGKWKVTTYEIGATDVAWDGWDRQYKAPPAIFR